MTPEPASGETWISIVVFPEKLCLLGKASSPTFFTLPGSTMEIQVSPEAGSGVIGENVFDIAQWDQPLLYPKLPVGFVKEQSTQLSLCLGYCQHPEKFEGDYARLYQSYARSHRKMLLKRAQQQKLKTVEEYFAADEEKPEEKPLAAYQPELKLKKPKEQKKVEILEETVLKGTLEDLKAVLKTYGSFELTARALGMAGRYRGLDFVKELVKNGASFRYESSAVLQKKYSTEQKTAAGSYRTEYYLMLVPMKLVLQGQESEDSEEQFWGYHYTPMFGVNALKIPRDFEEKVLPLRERMEVTRFLAENGKTGLSLDEMLFWALTRGEPEAADALIALGADLKTTPPSYYDSWASKDQNYLEILCTGSMSQYWSSYTLAMSMLKEQQLLPALERLHGLAAAAGKKLALTQKLFDELKWNDASLAFALRNMDCTKLNRKKTMETAVLGDRVNALAAMAEAGWLAQAAKRDGLIDFARENKRHDSLAWLLDFKNRTSDPEAEAAKQEAKTKRELSENPDSASALKKLWSVKKREDGTLEISSYKGAETEVFIPALIGKSRVTAVGENAFYARGEDGRIQNIGQRKKITSVTVPEGVTEIGASAFCGCESLETVKLPATLRAIGEEAFFGCKKLRDIEIPAGCTKIHPKAFWECSALENPDGLVIASNIVFQYKGNKETVRIPDGVKRIVGMSIGYYSSEEKDPKRVVREIILPEGLERIEKEAFRDFARLTKLSVPASVKSIGERAFCDSGIKTLELREGLESIGPEAFAKTLLEEVHIPRSVRSLGDKAFYGCRRLRDISIPAETAALGDSLLGDSDDSESFFSYKPSGVYVHTPAGSAAEAYMKRYSGVFAVTGED